MFGGEDGVGGVEEGYTPSEGAAGRVRPITAGEAEFGDVAAGGEIVGENIGDGCDGAGRDEGEFVASAGLGGGGAGAHEPVVAGAVGGLGAE